MKQAILIRNDLKLPKGKMAAQAAHASVEAVLRSDKDIIKEWRSEGMGKIALKVEDERELLKYLQLAKDQGLVCALITDAGRTCIAIGPDDDEKIDNITSDLKLM